MSWEKVILGNLCSVVTKGTTPTSVGLNFSDSGVPFLRIQDITNDGLTLEKCLYIDEEAHKTLKRSAIRAGDFLITIAGTIGKVAIVPDDFPECNCNQALAILRFDQNKLLPKFLYFWLQTQDAMSQIAGKKVTATISNLSLGQIKNLEISLPPLTTQKKIAEVLEKADTLRGQCLQMEQELNTLVQSVFLDMFVGKDFPLTKLEKLAANSKHALSSGPFGSSLTSKHYVEDGVLVLRGMNVTKGSVNLDKVKYISQEKADEIKRSKLVENDVVVVAVGASGYAISIPKGFPQAVMSQNFNKITPNLELVEPIYLANALNSDFVQRQINKEITDTVRTFLSLTKLKCVDIPVPPKELQKEFVERLSDIDALKSLALNRLSFAIENFNSLMQKAFKGELNLKDVA
ncbi:restriction endonuclease subunit S [Parashewanella tropica]|uniref:restriction endonuclease subunit S n=1 Tax=Parashewanella tropica TaxID=2547970 RepID=UPI0010596ECF|nr:restriction endonuclease subunit S [Parashewanella tropica]